MTDEEITEEFRINNNQITISQLNTMRSHDITAYNLKHEGNGNYRMWSRWGGSWEFRYKERVEA